MLQSVFAKTGRFSRLVSRSNHKSSRFVSLVSVNGFENFRLTRYKCIKKLLGSSSAAVVEVVIAFSSLNLFLLSSSVFQCSNIRL